MAQSKETKVEETKLSSPFQENATSILKPKLTSIIQPKVGPHTAVWGNPKKETAADNSATTQLPQEVQAKMENSFNQDFSEVNIHKDSSSAQDINAKAYAQGTDIHFAPGEYNPTSKEGQALIGHELTHVVQQGQGKVGPGEIHGKGLEINQNAALEKEADDAGKLASEGREVNINGVSGITIQKSNTHIVVSGESIHSIALRYHVSIDALLSSNGYALSTDPLETNKGIIINVNTGAKEYLHPGDKLIIPEPKKTNEEDDDQDIRVFGTWNEPPMAANSNVPANTNISPDIALKILENVSKGEPPFQPSKGKGGASWFVTEGNPYVGIDPSKNINIEVEIASKAGRKVFGEAQLLKLFQEELSKTKLEAEAKFRTFNNIPIEKPMSSKQMNSFTRFHKRFAESRMWDRVGEIVNSSSEKAGEVILEPGSIFSKTPGKFAVISDAGKIQIKGGINALIQLLEKNGLKAEPPLIGAAEAMATKLRWAGNVRSVFRYGGRVMIVVAIAADTYKIYKAQNKPKAIIEVAGGWAGATIASSAFAAWFTPADIAGPWAWAAHGVGTLIAGGVGYWVGSSTTKTIYELVLEG